ncbi:MspA family porin [Rhodococcus sp. BP-252]|uniref:MspA family porin n=1 Tax=unclassified Rhodococcus (in: high G+C Gram-positive bacteria) TaxID=192944 RepID=UPI001C9B5476|nr:MULTISPECIES: MspA family porin [unclassified Rhodococcus (in: high G+C Gram-positive bacteria)]MBY6414578.1 MspA family porin [Rhodococcus sp. BP-320]MBY6419335.1 MspA family porin [Rhodococcus sp. BP-321]MBY6424317.1 MspA family porin [Rhodococcus sp. BP-324]MBY6429414.1 MspA family porin [Rhodococcus sp. BP-323]MBY6431933.1 MspA family porin [Rhodococcus sp. BP-322]
MSSWVGRRLLVGAVVASGVVILAGGTAHADEDRVDSFVDGSGTAVTVTQSDTYINGVVPLDGNPLTREWFHNGRIAVAADGANAADFVGTVSVGYQFAYPMSIGGSVRVSFNSPTASVSSYRSTEIDEKTGGSKTTTTTDSEFKAETPRAVSELNLSPGPGTQEVEVGSADVAGELSEHQFAGIHGTATGVFGNVTIRPYVKVTSASGSSVVSYGAPWRLN